MSRRGISWRKRGVLVFLIEYQKKIGRAPSYREVATACGVGLTNAKNCLDWLQDEGYLSKDKGKERSIRILRLPPQDKSGTAFVPFIQKMANGTILLFLKPAGPA